MQEMFEMINKVILLMGLFYLAWTDFKTKLIKGKDLLVLAGVGMIMKIFSLLVQDEQSFLEICKIEFLINIPVAMFVGGMLFLAAKFTREQIGFGDALVFLMTGVFLNFIQNLILLAGTLLLAGIVSLGWLVLEKKGRDDSVAMMPFTLAAYVLFVL